MTEGTIGVREAAALVRETMEHFSAIAQDRLGLAHLAIEVAAEAIVRARHMTTEEKRAIWLASLEKDGDQ